MKTITKIISGGLSMCVLTSYGASVNGTMTMEESKLINNSPEVMRILTVGSESDLAVLRSSSTDFNLADISSPEYAVLVDNMSPVLRPSSSSMR